MLMNIVELLNNNAEKIISNIDEESIDVYLYLQDTFGSTRDINTNHLFQFIFRSYYRLDSAGLTPDFKTQYFKVMQTCRNNTAVDIKAICNELYELKNRKGQNTLQFSFATKMANMIDNQLPIYDSAVATMYDFKRPYGKDYDVRLSKYIDFYSTLQKHYAEYIQNGSLRNVVFKTMKSTLPNVNHVSDIKKLDFLVWSAGKLKMKMELQ